MKANYSYLSDGAKASVLNASGAGYDYNGTFTYSHATGGTRTLESVAFGGGRIRKNGSTYAVDYYVTDHLGSVRAIVNASGTRQQNGLTTLSANRWRFSGKEGYDSTFGIALDDFGARLFDRRSWTSIDPLAETYYSISPYAYCAGNPVRFVDPNGLDNYRYDDELGQFYLMETTDDDIDSVLGYHKNKETGIFEKNTKWYQVKKRIEGIEKGILKDGMNFKSGANVIEIGNEESPSIEGFQSFIVDFSDMIGLEIAGFYYDSDKSKYIHIGSIRNNTFTKSYATPNIYSARPDLLNIVHPYVHWHTHPSNQSFADPSVPSKEDIDYKEHQKNKGIQHFYIFTKDSHNRFQLYEY